MYGWRFAGRILSSGPMMVFWFGVAALTLVIGFAEGKPAVIFGFLGAIALGAVKRKRGRQRR